MPSNSNTVCLCLVLFVLGIIIVHSEQQPMVRPTRPDVFTSPEELRKYLDHVSDYYSISGKARYGKRRDSLSTRSDVNHFWNKIKTILENSHRPQQLELEERMQRKKRLLSDLKIMDNSNENHNDIQNDSRPCELLDTIDKYYNDLQ